MDGPKLSVGDSIWECYDEKGTIYGADIVGCNEIDGTYDLLYHGNGFQSDVQLEEGGFFLLPPASVSEEDLNSPGAKLAQGTLIELKDLIWALLDTEERLPESSVLEQSMQWWTKWRGRTKAVSNTRGLAKALLDLSHQLASSVTTLWWTESKAAWERKCHEATTNQQLRGLLRDLRIRAINWREVKFDTQDEPAAVGNQNEAEGGQALPEAVVQAVPEKGLNSGSDQGNQNEAEGGQAVPEGVGRSVPEKGLNLGSGQGTPAEEEGLDVVTVLDERDVSDCVNGVGASGEPLTSEANGVASRRPGLRQRQQQRGGFKFEEERAERVAKEDSVCLGVAKKSHRQKKLLLRDIQVESSKGRALRARSAVVGKYKEVGSDDEIDKGDDKEDRDWEGGVEQGAQLHAKVGGKRGRRTGKGKMESESSWDSSDETEEWEEEEADDYEDEAEEVMEREEVVSASVGGRRGKKGRQQVKGKGKGNKVAALHQEDDICHICRFAGSDDYVLLCDVEGCNNGFHTFCLNPPLHSIPSGDWVCPLCSSIGERGGGLLAVKSVETIYGCKESPVPDNGTGSADLGVVGSSVNCRRLYLVKWADLSHRHNTWVPEESLLQLNDKKVHSFVRKHGRSVHNMELPIDESKEEWQTVDRVLAIEEVASALTRKKDKMKKGTPAATRSSDGGKKRYLVKWRGLDYADATWEEKLEGKDFDAALRAYEKRKTQAEMVAVPKLSKRQREMRAVGGPAVEKAWPEVKNLLFEYQVEGVNWLMANFESSPPRSAILADEMGLGKTIQTAVFLARIRNEGYNLRPALVVAPVSTLTNWENEMRMWAPSLNTVIYKGDQTSRGIIQKYEFGDDVTPHVVVVGYEIASIDNNVLQKFHWSILVVDEGHKVKDNHSKLAMILQRKKTDFRLLLTGTPIQNNLTELFSLLHFISPDKVGDPGKAAEKFAKEGNLPMVDGDARGALPSSGGSGDGTQNLDEDDARENTISRLHDLLKPQMLRRLKKNVLKLPPRKLIEVPCALSPLQRNIYVEILERNHEALFSNVPAGKKRSLTNALVNLKLICNHPYLFPGTEPEVAEKEKMSLMIGASGKFQLLAKLLPKLKEKGHRTLLFSQSTLLLNLVEELMHFLGIFFFRLDGSTPQAKRQQQIDAFNKPDAREFVYLISTRAGGLGINLQTADTVIIYDPDYNPFADEQAQARAHRIGQEKPVQVYQLFTKCSVEERILEKAHKKLRMERIVMNLNERISETAEEIKSLLTHGAAKILDEQKSLETTSINFSDEDLERLMDRTETENAEAGREEQAEGGYLGSIQGAAPGVAAEGQEEEPVENSEDGLWKRLLEERVAKQEEARARAEMELGKRQRKPINYADADGESTDDDGNGRPRKRGRPRKVDTLKIVVSGGEPSLSERGGGHEVGAAAREGTTHYASWDEEEWDAEAEGTEESESEEEEEPVSRKPGHAAEPLQLPPTEPLQLPLAEPLQRPPAEPFRLPAATPHKAESKAASIVYYNGHPAAPHVSFLTLTQPTSAVQPLSQSNPQPTPAVRPLSQSNPQFTPAVRPLLQSNPQPNPAVRPLSQSNLQFTPAIRPLSQSYPQPTPAVRPLSQSNPQFTPAIQPLSRSNARPLPPQYAGLNNCQMNTMLSHLAGAGQSQRHVQAVAASHPQRDGLCSANMPGTEYRTGGYYSAATAPSHPAMAMSTGLGPPAQQQVLPRLDASPASQGPPPDGGNHRSLQDLKERQALLNQSIRDSREREGAVQESLNKLRDSNSLLTGPEGIVGGRSSDLAYTQPSGTHGRTHGGSTMPSHAQPGGAHRSTHGGSTTPSHAQPGGAPGSTHGSSTMPSRAQPGGGHWSTHGVGTTPSHAQPGGAHGSTHGGGTTPSHAQPGGAHGSTHGGSATPSQQPGGAHGSTHGGGTTPSHAQQQQAYAVPHARGHILPQGMSSEKYLQWYSMMSRPGAPQVQMPPATAVDHSVYGGGLAHGAPHGNAAWHLAGAAPAGGAHGSMTRQLVEAAAGGGGDSSPSGEMDPRRASADRLLKRALEQRDEMARLANQQREDVVKANQKREEEVRRLMARDERNRAAGRMPG